jgi:serine/threonine-protein kinase
VEEAHARGAASEEVRATAGEILMARGEAARAARLLQGAHTPPALLLEADAWAETGAVSRALALVERVLSRDFDAPGARERHDRWRIALGGGTPAALTPLAEPTLLRAEAPETSLRIVGEAGRGGAGTVYQAVDDALGRRVALKVYHQPERERDKLAREARMAVELAGAGVVRVYDVDLDRGYLVLEWIGGGSLKEHLVKRRDDYLFPIEAWLVPLLRVLDRVHRAGFVHGDLKPANVMFERPGVPLLGDFGLTQRAEHVLRGGSLGYMSPERVRGEASGAAEDLYGVGRLIEDVSTARCLAPPWSGLVARLLDGARDLPDAGALLRAVEVGLATDPA